jgi:LuxR family transcriptional regulator, maltose regulon positive regulatory protein
MAWNSSVRSFVRRVLALTPTGTLPAAGPPDGGCASFDRLSPRELDILELAVAAWRNQDIAERLGLTEGTVKGYLHQVYDKLGVRKRSVAVERARCFGIIQQGTRPGQASPSSLTRLPLNAAHGSTS